MCCWEWVFFSICGKSSTDFSQVHFIYDATNFCFSFYCLSFDLYTGESGILNLLTLTGLRLIHVSTSSSICFMKLCVPMFATYMSRIKIYSLKVFSLINLKWPHLSLLVTFSLKSISEILESLSMSVPSFLCLEHLFPFFLP